MTAKQKWSIPQKWLLQPAKMKENTVFPANLLKYLWKTWNNHGILLTENSSFRASLVSTCFQNYKYDERDICMLSRYFVKFWRYIGRVIFTLCLVRNTSVEVVCYLSNWFRQHYSTLSVRVLQAGKVETKRQMGQKRSTPQESWTSHPEVRSQMGWLTTRT